MKGKIESATVNKTGRSLTVTIDGQRYMCNKMEIKDHIGQTVEFEKGKFNSIDTIESFTVTTGGEPVASAPVGGGGYGDRWWMAFVSNTVAHAISAGLIKTPSDIPHWARCAKDAAVNLEPPY